MTGPSAPLSPSEPNPARRPWRKGTLAALILAVLTLFALAYGYGRQPARTRLEFRHHWTGTYANLASDSLQRFAATHPHIDLQPLAVHNHWSKQYLLESVQNNSLPDVITMSSGLVDLINHDADLLLPLEPLARSTGDDLARLLPARELIGLSPRGELRALPLSARFSAATMLINLDVVEQAGLSIPAQRIRTWAEFTDLSRQLVDALNPPGQLNIVAWHPLFDRGYPMVGVLSYGHTPIISADGRTSLLDRPEVRAVWLEIERYLRTVYDSHGGIAALLQWRQRNGGFSVTTTHTPFAHGRVAFNFGGLQAIAAQQKLNPALRVISHPIPGLNGPILLPVRSVGCIGISRQCRDPAAAWQLVRYLALTREGNSPVNFANGTLSAVPELNDLAAYQKSYGPAWTEAQALTEHLPSGQITLEVQWLDEFNLDFLSHRATDEPLDRTIQRMHLALQTWLDQRTNSGRR